MYARQLTLTALLSLTAGSAFASHVSLGMDVWINGSWQNVTYESTETALSGSAVQLTGTAGNSMWDYGWDLTVDPDPVISGSLTFTNTTAMTQSYSVLLTLSTPSSSLGHTMTGTVFAGTGVSDSTTDGDSSAQLSNIAITGLIDGSNAMNIFAGGLSCGIPIGSSGCSASLGADSINGPALWTAGITGSIGIRLNFDLSAGDTATLITAFDVQPVPLPAALWLFGSGLLGLAGLARRR